MLMSACCYYAISVLWGHCDVIGSRTEKLNRFSRSGLTLGANSEGLSLMFSQPRFAGPPRASILLWSLKMIHKICG